MAYLLLHLQSRIVQVASQTRRSRFYKAHISLILTGEEYSVKEFPTVNFTPFVTGSLSQQHPYEDMYMDPVFDMRDLTGDFDANGNPTGDGAPDNPGDILYHVPTRTGQKNNTNLSVGFSMTWSTPLDKTLQDQCKEAAQTQIALQQQLTANKRLDFEIGIRLKNCGELLKQGIRFHPRSKYAAICADVIVENKNAIAPHRHTIPIIFKIRIALFRIRC